MTDSENLVRLLPHRPPILLLDHAEMAGESSLVARQTIPAEHPVLAGHFPGFPIWPGVLLMEAMAQTTAIVLMAQRETPLDDAEVPVLGAVDGRFLAPVRPGDQISYRTELVRRLGDRALFSVQAERDGQPVARARISSGIGDRSTLFDERQ